MTDSELRDEDNKIYKRLPKHLNSDFMMTLIGRLQKIQNYKVGKAFVVFIQDPSTPTNWHPEDATRINKFRDFFAWILFELTAFLL